MDYLTKKDSGISKKEMIDINVKLTKQLDLEEKYYAKINMENFYTTKKPVTLKEAIVWNKLDKHIEGHIIVCGIVNGIKNLILPLRSKY
jgi:intracellular septation protein A